MIPYGRQEITDSDVEAVVSVLRSDFLTQGPAVPQFEDAIASFVGAKHAVGVNSATSALHIACLSLNLGPGDWLWTSPISFVASANCGLYCGANIDFVDINPLTFNICALELEKKLISSEKVGLLPKILVVVHLCGQPCDLAPIRLLSIKYGFKIIEDASHAIGAKYNGKLIGACDYSDITVFSFHPVKIITAGEGGMALTNDDDIARRLRLMRSHGITREANYMTQDPDGAWYYQQIELGFNYRLTDLQAALGMSQLTRLVHYVKRRHEIADYYDESFKSFPVRTPWRDPICYSSFHLYVLRLNFSNSSNSRKTVFDNLRAQGIGVNVHYIPIHLNPYFKKMGFKRGDFPKAEHYYDEAISIPIFPSLTLDQQNFVITAILRALEL